MFTEFRSRTRLLTVPAAFALSLALSACAEDETIVEEAEEQPGIQLFDGEEVTIEGEVRGIWPQRLHDRRLRNARVRRCGLRCR